MKILMPMAGEGKRFKEAGYELSKPAIATYDFRTGDLLPMVVCATLDLPGVETDGENVIYVERDFHRQDGTEDRIRRYFPKSIFLTVDHLTQGQACTCLLAEELIDNQEELLIAGCDNGMELDAERFEQEKDFADALVFTYRNNPSVLNDPDAYGWMIPDGNGVIKDMSIKKAISNTPMKDHAVVASFWFKSGSLFVEAAKRMIMADDRVNGEFYVDEVIRHILEIGGIAKVFEVDRYIGWGTPEDHEAYQKTFEYWRGFCIRERGRLQ